MLTGNTASQLGATLIELMIGLVIIAILMTASVPLYRSWIQNAQIRGAAENIQNGLQLARAEAVHLNGSVRFQLTSTLTNSCAASSSGPNWVVSLDDVTGACGITPAPTTTPRIIQAWAATEGAANVAVTADQASIIFNGLGRVTPLPASAIKIDIKSASGAACATATVEGARCLRVVVAQGGQVRLCDPLFSMSSGDPQGC